MLLDLTAHGVAVLIGHDDIGDDGVGRILIKLRDGGGGVAKCDHGNIFAAEGDLDDFAHGGTVVDEIDGWSTLGRSTRFSNGRKGDGFAHVMSSMSFPAYGTME